MKCFIYILMANQWPNCSLHFVDFLTKFSMVILDVPLYAIKHKIERKINYSSYSSQLIFFTHIFVHGGIYTENPLEGREIVKISSLNWVGFCFDFKSKFINAPNKQGFPARKEMLQEENDFLFLRSHEKHSSKRASSYILNVCVRDFATLQILRWKCLSEKSRRFICIKFNSFSLLLVIILDENSCGMFTYYK